MVLEDGGRYGRLFAAVDGTGGDAARGIHDVAVAQHAGQQCFNALEPTHRQAELLADAGIGAGSPHTRHRATGGTGGQRDAAPHRQLFDEHAPALAGHCHTADQTVERHEHVMALDGAVLEGDVEREMATANLDARRIARQQCAADADVGLGADQMIRVKQAEGQADDRGHRCQRDVTLVEVEADAQHFIALVHTAAHHTGIANRGCIRPDRGAGQRKAGHFLTACQARQVVVLLGFGAVVHQQLGRPE